MMYVAVTRARKTLTITHARSRLVNGVPESFEPSRFLQEIPAKRLNRIDDEKMRSPKKTWGRDNRDYGGDAFDDTRDSLPASRAAKPAPAPSAPRPELRTQEALVVPTRGQHRRVAIIGTAGRDKDKTAQMTKAMWGAMLADAKSKLQPGDSLVSGGAAWADHLAVRLFLDGAAKGLVLHLPAPLGDDGRFVGPGIDQGGSAASAANYYHQLFQRSTGVDGFKDIAEAIRRGATVTVEPEAPGYGAMNARNRKVAFGCDAVIAYTWGQGDEPADGGTKQTWDMAAEVDRTHVPMAGLVGSPALNHTAGGGQSAPAPAMPTAGPKPWMRRGAAAVAADAGASGPSESTMRRLQSMRRPSAPRPR